MLLQLSTSDSCCSFRRNSYILFLYSYLPNTFLQDFVVQTHFNNFINWCYSPVKTRVLTTCLHHSSLSVSSFGSSTRAGLNINQPQTYYGAVPLWLHSHHFFSTLSSPRARTILVCALSCRPGHCKVFLTQHLFLSSNHYSHVQLYKSCG